MNWNWVQSIHLSKPTYMQPFINKSQKLRFQNDTFEVIWYERTLRGMYRWEAICILYQGFHAVKINIFHGVQLCKKLEHNKTHLIIKFYRTELNLYLMIHQAYQKHAVLQGDNHHRQLLPHWRGAEVSINESSGRITFL